jgi:uncharacterized coiled-coil DUF342 family protein
MTLTEQAKLESLLWEARADADDVAMLVEQSAQHVERLEVIETELTGLRDLASRLTNAFYQHADKINECVSAINANTSKLNELVAALNSLRRSPSAPLSDVFNEAMKHKAPPRPKKTKPPLRVVKTPDDGGSAA